MIYLDSLYVDFRPLTFFLLNSFYETPSQVYLRRKLLISSRCNSILDAVDVPEECTFSISLLDGIFLVTAEQMSLTVPPPPAQVQKSPT